MLGLITNEALTGVVVAFLGTLSAYIAARFEAKRRAAREDVSDDRAMREELRDDKKELRDEIKELKVEREEMRTYILALEKELRAVYLARGDRQKADLVLEREAIVLPLVDKKPDAP